MPAPVRVQLPDFAAYRGFLHAPFLLAHIDFLDETIEQVSREIAERLRPFDEEIARLDTIPGVGERTAQVMAAEIGLDMDQFPSADHLASWAFQG